MLKPIIIATAYPDTDDLDTIIIHAKDGSTYLLPKSELEKLNKLF